MPRKTKKVQNIQKKKSTVSLSMIIGMIALFFGLSLFIFVMQQQQDFRLKAAPPASDQTDRTNLSFKGSKYTSEYHLYAAGLDWTKPVGLMMYTDGSGESGLKNPTGDYLMGGSTGLIAVAKKHNMVLLTPFSPNKNCSDGDGSCWYDGDTAGYAKWAEELVVDVETRYGIDKRRVIVGGYSSGATFTTTQWIPSGAAQRTMDAGVTVAISYGGSPWGNEVAYTPSFKANVHMNWNGGDADESYNTVREGYDHYTKLGFKTSIDVIPGKGHSRSGEFGPIYDALITKYIAAAPSAPTSAIVPTNIDPTYVCGGSGNCVPSVQPTQVIPTTQINPTEPILEPTDSIPDPTITVAPDQNNNDNNQGNNGNKKKEGIFALFIRLLELILKFMESLFK